MSTVRRNSESHVIFHEKKPDVAIPLKEDAKKDSKNVYPETLYAKFKDWTKLLDNKNYRNCIIAMGFNQWGDGMVFYGPLAMLKAISDKDTEASTGTVGALLVGEIAIAAVTYVYTSHLQDNAAQKPDHKNVTVEDLTTQARLLNVEVDKVRVRVDSEDFKNFSEKENALKTELDMAVGLKKQLLAYKKSAYIDVICFGTSLLGVTGIYAFDLGLETMIVFSLSIKMLGAAAKNFECSAMNMLKYQLGSVALKEQQLAIRQTIGAIEMSLSGLLYAIPSLCVYQGLSAVGLSTPLGQIVTTVTLVVGAIFMIAPKFGLSYFIS